MKDSDNTKDDEKEKFSLFNCSKKEFKEWFDPL